uniref:PPPDE domain-containing protein n=1 Tax=Tanacetum cinerariifolium TaxID=118510 RepID=A0A6L2MSC8_TANCI|nr:hypothetical protein [Tanacetum cinerariifolium]
MTRYLLQKLSRAEEETRVRSLPLDEPLNRFSLQTLRSVQYLTFTRPDITYAVQQLFSYTTDSLIAYSDADWAGCLTTRWSTLGYCVFLGNNLLSWSSKRQPTLSRSSAEAEYCGVANDVAKTCWIWNLLRELHTPLSSPTIVYCDNNMLFRKRRSTRIKMNGSVPVYLNVYDLTSMSRLDSGVQVYGTEYAYGGHQYATTGIYKLPPTNCKGFIFRRQIPIGWTNMSLGEVTCFMEELAQDYKGTSYNLITRNCNHFSNDVCLRLTGNAIPSWINRLARLGKSITMNKSIFKASSVVTDKPSIEHHSPQHDPSPPSHQPIISEPIPQAPTETPTLKRYTRRDIRIAQSKALSPAADKPVSLPRDDRQGEDDDEDPEEDPVDYPVDGGDDDDDEEGLSKDDEDDDMDIEADEEEEHPAPADSIVVALPAVDQAPSAKETEPFKTDKSAATQPPHPAFSITARISISAPVPVPAWSDSKVARLLAMSTPPSSPLSPLFSPPPQIPFPPLPPILSPPSPVLSPAPPSSPIRSLGYRAAMIRLRAKAASTFHSPTLPPPFILSPTRSDAPSSGIPPPLPISAPTSSPPLQLPSTSRRKDRPEVTLPPRKRLGITLGPGYEVGESSSSAAARPAGGLRADYGFVAIMDREIRHDPQREVGYGITDSWDEIVETLQGAPVSTDTELGGYIREFETRVKRDTDEIYSRLDDEQSERQLLAGPLNMLFRDRRARAYTRHLMETEGRLSREAWVRSIDASDLARGEVMSLRTTVLGQTTEIKELHAADRRRQIVTSEMLRANHRRFAEIRGLRTSDRTRQQQLIQTLRVMQSLQRQVTPLQEQVTTLQGQAGSSS